MITVGIRELKQQASELIRLVRENGSEIQITRRGKVVALIIPARPVASEEEQARAWADLDQLAVQIGKRWPEGVSAAGAVDEGRQ